MALPAYRYMNTVSEMIPDIYYITWIIAAEKFTRFGRDKQHANTPQITGRVPPTGPTKPSGSIRSAATSTNTYTPRAICRRTFVQTWELRGNDRQRGQG